MSRVLADHPEPSAASLREVLALSQVEGLVRVLDGAMLEFLRRFLSEVTVRIPVSTILEQVEAEVGSADDEEAVPRRFRELYAAAVEQAQRSHPGRRLRFLVE